MGYLYKGDAVLGASLTVNSKKPLDSRSVVANTQELYTIPKNTAYKGMTVANIANGNLYMLVGDQLNPSNELDPSVPQQWKASYESIQIVTCTQQEYEEWENNTDNYVAIDADKPYLREDVYYYIFEDSIIRDNDKLPGEEGYDPNENTFFNQAYVSYAQLYAVQQQVSEKATSTEVADLRSKLGVLENDLESNYTTSEQLVQNYVTFVNLQDALAEERNQLSNYYTISQTDEKFVTLDWLKGDVQGDNYVFITNSQYTSDIQDIQSQLDSTLKTEEDGSIKNLTVETLTSAQEELNINTESLKVNSKNVALVEDVPKIEVLEQQDYESRSLLGTLEDDVYYYTFSEKQDDGVITHDHLTKNYYTKNEVEQKIQDAIRPILLRLVQLEKNADALDFGELDKLKLR